MRGLILTRFPTPFSGWVLIGLFHISVIFHYSAWCEEKIAIGNLVWEIHLAAAREIDQKNLEIPKEIENARGALEKLAEKSHFRQFSLHKSADLPCETTRPIELAWDPNLKFSFSVKKEKEKSYLEAAWLRREEGSPSQFKQIGGRVRKVFQPEKSLVLLGPRVDQGTAMAVLHLKPAPAMKEGER